MLECPVTEARESSGSSRGIIYDIDSKQPVAFAVAVSASGMERNNKVALIVFVVGVVVAAVAGFLCAYAFAHSSLSTLSRLNADAYRDFEAVSDHVMDAVDVGEMFKIVRWTSQSPHVAATQRDRTIADWIRQSFLKIRLDSVSVRKYDALLSYPTASKASGVELLDGSGTAVFATAPNLGDSGGAVGGGGGGGSLRRMESLQQPDDAIVSEALRSGDGIDYGEGGTLPYNAYSPSGIAEAPIVYVNYARESDFARLKELGVTVAERIVIARNGEIYRGNKVANAELVGAKAVLLYSDPEDTARAGQTPSAVFPNTWWLPGNGIHLGTVLNGAGDPLTPGWPSVQGAHRLRSHDDNGRLLLSELPSIPVHPISYNDARTILKCLGGQNSPYGWAGKLTGVEYKLGGVFKPPSAGNGALNVQNARVTVNNDLVRAKVANVVGVIKGYVEPDRYVVVGAHRDSWSFGAVDPGTATAALVMTARSFAKTMTDYGWRPRRSVVFASWGAEEFGLIGSTEWVEENLPKLSNRAVAYVNSDMCVSGPSLDATASPALKSVLVEAAKKTPHPSEAEEKKGRSYYDFWLDLQQGGSGGGDGFAGQFSGMRSVYESDVPPIGDVSSESDHGPFAFRAGLPVMNVRFRNRRHNVTDFPTYHTSFDRIGLYRDILDKDLSLLGTCGKLFAHAVRHLADARLLPHDVLAYARAMSGQMNRLRQRVGDSIEMREQNITLDGLNGAIDAFFAQAKNWTLSVNDTDFYDPLAVRALNDQIMELDRIFVLPGGLPLQNGTMRHGIFAPGSNNVYGSAVFPGIYDLLRKIRETDGNTMAQIEKRNALYEDLRRHISDVMVAILQAASHLTYFHLV